MWAQKLVAPGRFEQIDIAAPRADDLEPGEVILKTLAGGVCGSDFPFVRGQLPLSWGMASPRNYVETPGFPLHEVVGEVVATASDLEVGARVVGWASRSNAISEYIVTSAAGLAPYDSSLEPDTAVLLQPLACVIDAVDRMLPSIEGRDVVVLGLGPIGLLFGHVARSRGARRVRGVDRVLRTDLGKDFGFDETICASSDTWANDLAADDRPDVVVEAVGHQQSTFGHAVEALGQAGLLYYFGIPDDYNYTIPMQTLLRKNLTVMTGIVVEKRKALDASSEYLRDHPSLREQYVTHRFLVGEVTRAFEVAMTPSPGRAKVVLQMV
ncbi:zinc-binding dehydrogenase [Mycobacterium sp. CBMA293]|nr:zinc-binding dehydrogenase [Mycolicibacterium sp. CBMA 360]MUL62573.1 zinc-binding dehydrogenase [Mycolicibacterium sp. CBMA 335]MUL69025.1 zinc-binding dehydrogenase [Mycolicibacterium sp. CBMA 311]MUL96964.1 zinc-binding dehydrogenase [Mycolicibacterium sp. CBMA 230]MUM03998.1 hypothetical protein [Mycolicibacterium sp. CBMA 213]MUM13431.1 zinc-binding dehydrogenase [Mycolicibacterium sp. CBMA 293]MUM30454.1 zinc-binding dehydrogenase [Mycolicibacterium sp. CBMA 361]